MATKDRQTAAVEQAIGLSEVYKFPDFGKLYSTVFGQMSIPKEWRRRLRFGQDRTILEIGAGSGRFTGLITQRANGKNAYVRAMEPRRDCLERLGSLRKDFEGSLSIELAQFPCSLMHGEKYSHIFMVQNTFLEIVNENSKLRDAVGETLQELNDLRRNDGKILFDLPMPMQLKKRGTIFKGHIDGIGDVDYSYSNAVQNRNSYSLMLSYSIASEKGTRSVKSRLGFYIPPLREIEEIARRMNLNMQTHPIDRMPSFFPAQHVIVELGNGNGTHRSSREPFQLKID